MTNFRDTQVTCQACDRQFVFTVEKQRKLADQGRPTSAPELCDGCRTRVKYGGKGHGRIKWFSAEKGYGFITEDGGNELFVHRQGIAASETGALPELAEGQEVLYEVMETTKGPQAVQVVPYSG